MLDQILRLPHSWAPEPNEPQTFEEPYAPLSVRWSNAVLRRWNGWAEDWLSLDFEALREAAEARTGLRDWGERFQREALRVLVDCLAREGELTPFGRLSVRQYLLRHLSNRLRVVEALRRFPEIRRVEIRAPIFIVGWYRTSTTFLHNLLATSPGLRAPLLWELSRPWPAGDPRRGHVGRVLRETRLTRRIHRFLSPGFDAAHPMDAERPDECLHLFENAGVNLTSCFISEAKSFAWWLLEQDLRPAYRFYREQLQVLQWLRPQSAKRWLLKWPYHFWHLDALLDVFPDARVVCTHRDPLKAVPSVCSLAALARAPMCERIDTEALGRFWLDYFEAGLLRGRRARRRIDRGSICDVEHDELTRDPEAKVRRLCGSLGLEAADMRPRLHRYLEESRRRERRVHRYRLEQFGLDADEVRSRLVVR